MDIDHKDNLSRIKKLARAWHKRYPYIEQDEMFSELLVTYTLALNTYDDSKATSVMTWFHVMALNTLRTFRCEHRNRYMHTQDCQCDEEELLDIMEVVDLVDRIGTAVFLIDASKLNDDGTTVLGYVLNVGIDSVDKRKYGLESLACELVKEMGWPLRRARKAVSQLGRFYDETA